MSESNSKPSNQLVYSGLSISGKWVIGGCSSWNSFLSQLNVQSVTRRAVAVTSTTVTSLVSTATNASVACLTPATVANIINMMGSVFGDPSTKAATFTCPTSSTRGHTWSIGSCAAAPALCVDCQQQQLSVLQSLSPCSVLNCLYAGTVPQYAGVVRVFVVEFRAKQPAPRILKIAAVPSTKSIAVTVTLDANGLVYCAALVKPPSSYQTILLANNAQASVGNQSSLQLLSLIPSTAYQIYCLSVSTDGVQSQIVSGASAVSTLCCKVITVDLSIRSAKQNQVLPNIMQISIDGLPSSSLTLRVVASPADPSEQRQIMTLQSPSAKPTASPSSVHVMNAAVARFSAARSIKTASMEVAQSAIFTEDTTDTSPTSSYDVFFPTAITYLSTAAISSTLLALSGASRTGFYAINVTLSGPSAREYAVSFSRGNTFTIIDLVQEPPPPQLLMARFSSDGASLALTFDSATNQGGGNAMGSAPFKCASLFMFQGSAASTCQWSSDASAVTVQLGSASTINVGAPLMLLPRVVKAQCPTVPQTDCSSWKFAANTTVPILLPNNPTIPTVIIMAPDTIGEMTVVDDDIFVFPHVLLIIIMYVATVFQDLAICS